MKWKKSTEPAKGKYPGLRKNTTETVDGMEITWDVPVTMRDGCVLYVDIFRPEHRFQDERLPIILTYSPYGKHGPKTFDIFPNSGVPKGSVSPYAVWEGPDPLYFTKQGYAMINADARGSWACEGDCTIFSPQQARDGYDLVEWAAALPWSNERVGMAGVSYLAIIQWHVAALNPPHLACIVPWEGLTDPYREVTHHGGIPETNFVKFTEWSCQYGLNRVEDWVGMQRQHHSIDAYHKSKQPNLSAIQCPAYIVADWGDHGLHTRGTLIGYENIGSKEKWLEIHGQKKWQYYYQSSSLERQNAFYRKFLKLETSEVDEWPRVRWEVRRRAFSGSWRDGSEWPPKQIQEMVRYLNAHEGTLQVDKMQESSVTHFDSTTIGESVEFVYTFDRSIEVTGSMRLRLWVSTDENTDDMDLFVQLDKLVETENGVRAAVPFVAMSMIDNGPQALGWLRVSHREIDEAQSTTCRPVHPHERELKLLPGEVVPVDIEIWPSSTSFEAGDQLKVRIAGNDIFRYDLPQVQLHEDTVNRGELLLSAIHLWSDWLIVDALGKHRIYTGGRYESYLVMPVMENI